MKHLSIFSLLFVLVLGYSCDSSDNRLDQQQIIISDTITTNSPKAVGILYQQPDAKWDKPQAEYASGPENRLEVNFEGKYEEVFNDSNYLQVGAAEAVGITPITNMASAWNLKRPLELIASCEEYYLEEYS